MLELIYAVFETVSFFSFCTCGFLLLCEFRTRR